MFLQGVGFLRAVSEDNGAKEFVSYPEGPSEKEACMSSSFALPLKKKIGNISLTVKVNSSSHVNEDEVVSILLSLIHCILMVIFPIVILLECACHDFRHQ